MNVFVDAFRASLCLHLIEAKVLIKCQTRMKCYKEDANFKASISLWIQYMAAEHLP